MAEKMRVHILAKELSVSSKTIIEKCKAEGIGSVKNHMSTLSAGLHATIYEWFSETRSDTAVETAGRIDLEKVRIKRRRKEKAAKTEVEVSVLEAVEEKDAEPVTAAALAPAVVSGGDEALALPTGEDVPTPAAAELATPVLDEPPIGAEAAVAEAPTVETPSETLAEPEQAPAEFEAAPVPEPAVAEAGEAPGHPVVGPEETPTEVDVPDRTPEAVAPAGPQNVPAKAKLRGPRVVRYEAPEYNVVPVRYRSPAARHGAGTATPSETRPAEPAGAGTSADRGFGRRKGRVTGRRAEARVVEPGGKAAGWGDRDLAERRERLAGATGRRIRRRATHSGAPAAQPMPAGPKTEATVHEPIRMKEFCSAAGLNFMQCFRVLKDEHSILANVNMTLPTETAELLALHFGIELTVIPSKTRLDELKEEFAARRRDHLTDRPPVVTMLGHVDHGKTSLLDAIRKARVVAGEDGGITQHIGAYHVKTSSSAVTFLDTPGHQAFTAMRARGARMTDVVVLVVAADDGIMPQTIEAINHAKAADVPIVVALNKIDLGDQNKLKIYGQLAEHGLTPSGEWGGETDVIPTSATTGEGVRQLLDHLAELSGLLELRADPELPATGAVIEAETKPGVGAVVRLLVQEGTLRVGDGVVCGPASGKVRALLDDRCERITEAGPSLPVEVWGLDDVPAAGDTLYTVENLQRAKDIATETKRARIENSRIQSRKVVTLEEMFRQRDSDEVPELNLIIKADVDGSVAALAQSLSELPSDEVRLTIRHSGVGAVNDSDVLLASACRGIVAAFRVETAVGVRRLAEQHGVDVRSYRVIYDVCDDIKKALEGLLAPEERIESRATAEVRELFRLSRKAGVIAGSYVTRGTIDRNHLAKIIRDGVVVREGCKFASIRRFKDDIKEVRAGLECGIRLEGFDDIHVGDLVETYEIVKVARTL